MIDEYICGCPVAEKRNYSVRLVPDAAGKLRRTDKHFDKHGFQVCPEHGERLKNWKSDYMKDSATVSTWTPNTTQPDIRDTRDPQEVYEQMQLERLVQANGHGEQPA